MNRNVRTNERLLLQVVMKAMRLMEQATAKRHRHRTDEWRCDRCGAPRVRKR